jgi:hypothetical protein
VRIGTHESSWYVASKSMFTNLHVAIGHRVLDGDDVVEQTMMSLPAEQFWREKLSSRTEAVLSGRSLSLRT